MRRGGPELHERRARVLWGAEGSALTCYSYTVNTLWSHTDNTLHTLLPFSPQYSAQYTPIPCSRHCCGRNTPLNTLPYPAADTAVAAIPRSIHSHTLQPTLLWPQYPAQYTPIPCSRHTAVAAIPRSIHSTVSAILPLTVQPTLCCVPNTLTYRAADTLLCPQHTHIPCSRHSAVHHNDPANLCIILKIRHYK